MSRDKLDGGCKGDGVLRQVFFLPQLLFGSVTGPKEGGTVDQGRRRRKSEES